MLDGREHMFDLRVVQIYLKRGLVTPEEYKKYLETLEDSAPNSADTDTRFVPTFANRQG
ncbi:MAG: hypothetical protein H0V89_08165 [Deltaproteobacteria bacterium]|nr:hypothetical protein [Deltaproteobacteria bacterium]